MSSDNNVYVPELFSLVFEDNFDDIGGQPNSDDWTYDIGHGDQPGQPGWGWGNGEQQRYTSDPANVTIVDTIASGADTADTDHTDDNVNGALKIVANKTGQTITSARVKSDIEDLGAYGYYEIRAKLPAETGAWPAIWLLGQDGPAGWPDTGEIDLVEWSANSFGTDGTRIISAFHYRGDAPQGSNASHVGGTTLAAGTTVEDWHTYQVWWSPDEVRIGVDGNIENAHLSFTKVPDATNDHWPFDHPMDLIMNIAIGGTLGGAYDANQDFNYEMLVDYVRVYQGDWTTIDAESYVAAAEGVTALMSDVYAVDTESVWAPSWGPPSTYAGVVQGAQKYTGVTQIVIEPATLVDISDADMVHLSVFRTDANADLTIKLVNYTTGAWSNSNTEGSVTLGAGTSDAVEAGRWVELVIPKSDFGLSADDQIGQLVIESHNAGTDTGSGETVYLKEVYVSDASIAGPATDADVSMDGLKNVVALQGDEDIVDVGTNFLSNGHASTTTSTVTLGGDKHVQKYESTVWLQITPDQPIDITDLTTLHMSVYRTGGQLDNWGGSDLKVVLVYDNGTEDAYWFSDTRGDEAVPDQWNHLELPLAWMANSQAVEGLGVTDIILVPERHPYTNDNTYETLYLDNLSFSAKVNPDVPQDQPPAPLDDPQDVISIYSDAYGSDVAEFDPIYRWSVVTEQAVGTPLEQDVKIGDQGAILYQGVGMVAMTFSLDAYSYPAAERLDVSSMETLKLGVFRSDPDAQLRFALRYDDGSGAGVGVESSSIYFDADTSYGAVPAGQWHLIEIPLSDFTMPNPNYIEGVSDPDVTPAEVPVDLTQVTGLMMWSYDAEYEARTNTDGAMLDEAYEITTDPGAQAYDPVPSRETIYLKEFYFSTTPDAPRSAPQDPIYHEDTVLASLVGDAYPGDVVGSYAAGSTTVDGFESPFLEFSNTLVPMIITPTAPFTVAGAGADTDPVLHLDVWRADPGVPADLHVLLTSPDGDMSYTLLESAGVPTNQWVGLEIMVPDGFTVANMVLGLGEPNSGSLTSQTPPIPVESDGLYVGNLFFSDGSLVPAFEAPTGIELNFGADEVTGLVIEGFGGSDTKPAATATVKVSPNGDPAIEVIKPDNAETWAGASVRYPVIENQMSLVTQETPFVVMDILAPAAGETVRLEMQDSDDHNVMVYAEVTTTDAGWQTVRFDFTGQIDPTVNYDKTVFFPSFGDAGSGQTYFIDNVRLLDAVPNAVPAFAADSITVEINERDTVVYTAAAVDADAQDQVGYSLTGPDASLFTIDNLTGVVAFASAPDYETPGSAESSNSYHFTVVADDGVGGVSSQAVTVNVTDVAEHAVGAGSATFNFTIDGVEDADLELVSGQTHVLDLQGLGPLSPFFRLSATPEGTELTDPGVVTVEMVTPASGTPYPVLTIEATDTVPQLYYYSSAMPGMGGTITTPTVLTVTAANGKYFIDGVEQAYVDLDVGRLYKFDVSEVAGHPFRLSTTEDGTEYAGAGYTRAADGTVTLAVTEDTPPLYYYCASHSGMGGAMSLFPATPTGGEVIDFEGFTSNGDGTYALEDAQFVSYGSDMGRGLVTIKEEDGATDRVVLKLQKDAGTEWWSGVRLANELTGSDLIGDGTDPITMRVYAEQAGSLSLELWVGIAGTGPYTVTQPVQSGWNSLSFDVSGADASLNWDTIELRPDAAGKSGNDTQTDDAVYYIDDVHLPQATISTTVITAPPTPTTGAVYTFNEQITTADHGHWNGVYRGIESKAEVDGSTRSTLAVVKADVADWHAGVWLVDEYKGTDLIGDGTDPVTMRVFAEQPGTLTLSLYGPSGVFNAPTATLIQGWNDVSFDVSAADLTNNWYQAALRPDSNWPNDPAGEGVADVRTNLGVETKYYVDDVHFPQGSVMDWPAEPTGASFMAGATAPDEAAGDVVSFYSDGYSSALDGIGITNWSAGTMTEQTIDNGNKVQKFVKTTFAGFDVPGSVTAAGMDTLSISVWRAADSELEIKLVDVGGETGIYYVPAADMPSGQWSTVEIPLDSFKKDSNSLVAMASDQPIDQIVLKPMDGAETFYVDDFLLFDSGATDTGGNGGTGGSGGGTVTTTDYDSTEILHLGNADPASKVDLTISKTGADTLTVYVVSADDKPVDLITWGTLPTGATPSNMSVTNGVGQFDLTWASGTMPATTSFEVLWSKELFAGNWMFQPAHMGDIDTSFVATTDPTNTGGTGGSGGGTVTTTDYDSTEILHLGNADPASKVDLTISKTGADTLTVYVVSADDKPVDLITWGTLPTGATPSNMSVTNGVGQFDLTWASGTMPATTSFEVLWSKELFAGNWMFQPAHMGDIDTSFVATTDPTNTGGTGGSGGDDGGGSVTDLVANGSFDDATGWTGAAVNAVNGINEANPTTVANNPWDVNMETQVAINPGTDYTLTFRARGEADRLLDAGIGDVGGNWAADKEVNLLVGESWNTYTLHLDSSTLSGGTYRVFFDMGHDTGLVQIDDVSLVEGHVGVENLDPSNLITNGTFEDGTGWTGDGANAAGNINDADVKAMGYGYDVNMATTVATVPDTNYTLTFDAKGTDGRLLSAGIGDDGLSYASDKQSVELAAGWQTYTMHLSSAGQYHTAQRMFFEMGQDTGEVDIDNVRLVQGHVGTETLHLPAGDLLGATGTFDDSNGWVFNGANANVDIRDGVHFADVATAANPWDVNLSGEMKIAQGWDYTVTFRATGAEGRTILAGIGDNYAPHANDVTTVVLSDDWETYTVHVNADALGAGSGGSAGRVIFDMGADTGQVQIDDVTVVAGHVGSAYMGQGDGNLLANGTFENVDTDGDGIIDGWFGNALNLVGGVSQANVAQGGNPWDVNLSAHVGLNKGWDYTLTFDARGDAGKTTLAGIGDNFDPWTSDTQTVTVGPDWQTYTLHVSADGLAGGDGRVMFDMGADAGILEIDNVSLVVGHIGTPGVVPVPTPDTAAPAFVPAGDDVAVFIDAAESGVVVNPGWGQRGSLLPYSDADAGQVLAFHDLNYQGIDLGGARDLSGKATLHIDMWSATTGAVKVGLVSPNPADPNSPYEKLVEASLTGGQWNPVELSLSDFAGDVDLTDVIQIKFDNGNLSANAVPVRDFYMDNVAFVGTNEAPVLSAAAESGSGDEDHVITGQLAAATDNSGYHYVVVTDVGSGTLTLNEDGSYAFDPGTDFDDLAVGETRDVSFSYAAVDEQGAESAPKTVTLTVDGVNDAPVMTVPGPDISGHENEVLSGVLDTATDVDGSVSYRLIAGPDNGGTATIQADGTYGFDPGTDFDDLGAGETRVSSFRYEAIDADGGVSAEFEEVTVTVTGTNDAPTISTATETGTVAEGASILDAALADYTDPDDTSVVYEVVSYPAEGSLSVHPDGTYTFIAGPDFDDLGVGQTRDVSFSYRVIDGLDAESVPKTVTITVTGTNDEPTLAVVADQTVGQNSAAVLIDVLAGSTDIDGDNLSIVAVSSQQGATVTVDDGKISYQPATDFTGTDTVEYRVSDGTVEVEATITVNVPVNQAPEFGNDQGYLINEKRSDEEDGWSWSHQATAVDPDGDGLTYTLGGADGGDFAISGTGEVTFNQAPDYESGKTQYNFTVTASDGTLSDVQNVTVDIMNVDEVVTLGSAELSSGGTFAGEDLEDVLDGSSATVSLDMAGGGGDDTLTGGSAGDVLDGGDGDDILDGGDGNDVIITGGGLDRVYGGDGIDTVVMDSTVDEIQSVSLARKWQYSDDGWSYIEGVENVTTGAGTDIIQGSGDANVLDSGSGDDMLYAGGGDDTLVGGAGTDLLDGGDGNDTVVYETTDNLVVDLSSEWQVGNLNTSEGMDKLIDIENVTTGAGDDTLVGDAGANTLTGGDGNDELTGGDGADVFRFYASEGVSTDVITDFSIGEDTIELVNDTTDIIGDAVITTDANGSTVTWDELTIVLDVVVTKDDINPIVS